MTETIHALAQSLIARDTAVAHTLEDRVAAVRDKVASVLAAHEAAVAERAKRHADLIHFLNLRHEDENAAAALVRDAVVQGFVEEIDTLTKLADQIRAGESVLPVAAQLRTVEAPPVPLDAFEQDLNPPDDESDDGEQPEIQTRRKRAA